MHTRSRPHCKGQRATGALEGAREKTGEFLGAADEREIIFVRGATEGINLVASSWGGTELGPGDEIVLTVMEHHSNIVPWQLIAERTCAVIMVAPIVDTGDLSMDELEKLHGPRTNGGRTARRESA